MKPSQDSALLNLLADIRLAVGDPCGKLMQDELVEHCRRITAVAEKLGYDKKRLYEEGVQCMQCVKLLEEAFSANGKVLLCGNGGSAAMCSHFAAELVGRFENPSRRALPAVSLAADDGVLTALANDFGWEQVFARQVQALGDPPDVVIGMTTSHSRNVLAALEMAHRMGLKTLLIGSQTGGYPDHLDLIIRAFGENTASIQEAHLRMVHAICRGLDHIRWE